jgi:hypothetical protein
VPDQPSGVQKSLQTWKDGFGLLREVFIVGIFILLLAAPGKVNRVLSAAGFTKMSLWGVEWEKLRDQAEEANAEAAKAVKTFEQVEGDLKTARKQLEELSRRVDDPAVKTDIQNLSAQIQASETKAAVADDTLKSSAAKQQYVLQEIQRVQPRSDLMQQRVVRPQP